MTPAHQIEAVLSEDGKLLLDHLPFRAGQTVEVIILQAACPTPLGQSLRGTVLRYDQPTESVAEGDWGVMQRSFWTRTCFQPERQCWTSFRFFQSEARRFLSGARKRHRSHPR